ncbi:MAG TPA: response regulator [Candidatus Omnitrophota bacterium]|nr:response regulator [Candidatus Omnitrophota bacterium]HPN56701.1 response regulator [Candidatus Omnitrophota bacterium]
MNDKERLDKERDFRRLYDFVAQQVLAGLYKSDIIDKLIDLGVDRVTAADLVGEMERRMKNMMARTVLCLLRRDPWRQRLCEELRYLGFQPFITEDEEEAAVQVRKIVPNLIFLDNQVLASDGLNFIKALRQSPIGRKIPVFLLSDRPLQKDTFLAFKFVEFIEKPVSPSDICSRIKRLFLFPGEDQCGGIPDDR